MSINDNPDIPNDEPQLPPGIEARVSVVLKYLESVGAPNRVKACAESLAAKIQQQDREISDMGWQINPDGMGR